MVLSGCAPVGSTTPRPVAQTLDLVADWLGPLAGRSILDVGCGGGGLAAALLARGASVTGVDPQEEALTLARTRAPGARFERAGAQALPFADETFDAVVFLNSLHHVPAEVMEAALAEAARVSKGPVLVVEPLAEGPFFEAMRPVEDETGIRASAQAAIAAAVEARGIPVVGAGEFDDVRRVANTDAFLAMIVAVDPARAEAARREKAHVAALVSQWGTLRSEGIELAQPHRAHLLGRASTRAGSKQ